MKKIIWFWNDGSFEQYEVETKEQAEAMAIQLHENELITNVIISDF